MEINQLDEVFGVIPVADVKEGHFGLLTSHSFSNDFGSETDVPGWKVPADTTERKRARYMIGWVMESRDTPIFVSIPSFTFAMRQGFDQAKNTPFSATVYVTQPSNQQGLTIPSGVLSLAFGEGRYTLISGEYVYSSNLRTPGVGLAVQDATSDSTAGEAGKLKYDGGFDADITVAIVERFDSDTADLTIRVI